MAGLTLFWLLVASLWMPWFDYGKTYRGVAESLRKRASQENPDCVAAPRLPLSFLSSLGLLRWHSDRPATE